MRNFKEGRQHTIKDILTREYLILHTEIPIGGDPGEQLYLIDPLEKLLSQPNVHDKVNGFAFLRTFLNVRFEFTVAPKTSGGLIIAFFADMSDAAIANRTKKLIQISQTPHIKVSLTTSQSMEQKIPWVSAFLSRNLQSGSGRPGKIYIGRLTPLDIGTVKMNIYVSADPETLELEFPTIGAPLQDEAFLRQKVAQANQELRDMVSRNAKLHPVADRSKVVVSGRVPRVLPRKDVGTVKEASNMAQNGIVSAVLGEGAKVATAMSGLPMVGSTAASVAPLLSAGAHTAGAMGYSKPTMDSPVVAVKWKPGDGQLSAQTSVNSHIYSIDQGNSVATNYPLFGSELDEMSIDYIMKTPNILDNHIFKITDDQVTNQVLAAFPLTINPIVESDGLLYLSHQAWASSVCQNWNAQLHFQLDVFCTMFHNVKLRAIIAPNDHSTYAVGDIIDLEKINKATSTVMQFTGPKANQTFTAGVMSNSAMKYVASPFIVDGTGSGYEYLVAKQKTEFCSYGTAYITTEVPLEVTADAAHTIYCVPSFYATHVELSNPSTLINYLPAKHVGGSGLITGFENTSRSQVQTRGSPISTGPSLPQAGTRNLEISMGDQFTHLSKLLMAYLSFNNTSVLSDTKAIVVNPYQFRALEDSEYIDLVDYFAAGFGFYTGLMQMRLLTHEKQGYIGDSFIMSSFANQYFKNNSPTGYKIIEDAAYLNPGVRCIQHFAQEGVLDAKIPFYQPFHIARTSHSETFASWFEGQLPVHWYFKSTVAQKVRLYRAIHEDFKFGFLTGLPPFKINPNAIIHA